MQAQQRDLNKEFAQRSIKGQAYGAAGGAGYSKQIAEMKALQSAFNTVNSMSGQYRVSAINSASATEQLTKKIQANKFGYLDWIKNSKLVQANLKEQLALQRAVSVSWGTSATGKNMTSVLVPTGLQPQVKSLGMAVRDAASKIGYYSSVVKSASKMGSEWGRGLQRTGFQITQGIGMPLAALGAVAAAAFYSVDAQLVRVAKVYDTTSDQLLLAQAKNAKAAGDYSKANILQQDAQIAKTKELNDLRLSSTNLAKQVAQQYGQSMTSTLQVEAELAATGKKGVELLKSTAAVQKAATLGELSQEDAIKATIALQGIRNMSAKELGDTLNYVNSVENATSLSAQDWVESYAKIDPVMKSLGGSVQDTTTLLVGFKENGISATEGANAFRTGILRMITPTKVAIATAEKFGVNIEDIATKAGGKPIEMLKLLADRIKGLDNVQKTAVLGKLFGTQQLARMIALTDSLTDVKDSTSQVAAAMKVADAGTAAWAATADNELKTSINSASGRMKRMIETIKASLAAVGPAFLEAGISILNVINKIITGFSKLPSFVKTGLIIGTALTVIAGAAFLVVGAFVNLVLTLAAAGAGVLQLITGFRNLTPAQIAARQVTNTMTGALNGQATATGNATGRLTAYIAAMKEAAMVQAGIRTVTPTGGTAPALGPIPGSPTTNVPTYGKNVMGTPNFISAPMVYRSSPTNASLGNGAYSYQGVNYTTRAGKGGRANYYADNKKIDAPAYERASNAVKTMETNLAAAQANTKKLAAQAALTRTSFVGAASAIASFAMLPSLISTMQDGTASWSQKLTMALFTLGAMAPALGIIVSRLKAAAAAGLAGGFRAAGAALVGMLGPFGIAAAAIAAIGVSLYVINKRMNQWKKDNAALANSTDTWASVLGYTTALMTDSENDKGTTQESIVAKTKALKEQNEDLYNVLKNVKTQEEAINIARSQGLKVALSGGSAANVESAMRTALDIGGVKGKTQDDIININLKAVINNPEQVQQQLTDQINDLMTKAIDQADDKSWFSKTFDGGSLSKDAKKTAGIIAADFWTQYSTASGAAEKGNIFGDFVAQWNTATQPLYKKIAGDNSAAFSTLGIKNTTDLTKQVVLAQKYQAAIDAGLQPKGDFGNSKAIQARATLISLNQKYGTQISQLSAQEQIYAKTIAGNGDAQADSAKGILYLDQVRQKENLTYNNTASATNNAAGGMDNLADSTDGAGDALQDTALKASDFNDALKSAMSGTMDSVYDLYSKENEKQQDAALDRIEAAGQARVDKLDAQVEAKDAEFEARQKQSDKDFKARKSVMDAQQKAENKVFDKNWDNIMDNHDKRFDDQKKAAEDAADVQIKAIDDQIAAEEKADDIRERIFQAQQARVQRMSEMFNNSIDFNAALNSGNLDEAARIQNTSAATSIQWSADDTAATTGDASKAKRDKLNEQKDAIGKDKQNRLDAIDELEKAEKQQLEDRKDREKEELDAKQQALQDGLDAEQQAYNDSLDQEKDRYAKSADAQKKALEDQVTAQKKAAQDKFTAENTSIEQQLAAQKAMTPRTQAELDTQISNVRKTYENFSSTYVQPTAKSWGDAFGNAQTAAMQTAAATLRDKVNWTDIGNGITDELAGAFDISGDQLVQFLKTGVFPTGGGAPSAVTNYNTSGSTNAHSTGAKAVRHSGGPISWSSADRVGVPRSASLYPTEVPAILKRGEVVMNERASRAHAPVLAAMNAGNGSVVARHSGGGIGSGIGSTGLIGAAVAKAIVQSIASRLQGAVMSQLGGGYGTGQAGKYGNKNLNDEQLKNASIIMNVGKSMGATNRDLIVSLMTAMQESGLRNLSYGDRDSIGLFQQRPSQGWGTVAQIMDPQYSARKFFSELFKVKNRDSMPLTVEAQKVQKSGFPQAYAQWESMATAVVNGTPQMLGAAFGQGQVAGGSLTAGLTTDKSGRTYAAMEALLSRSGVPEQVTSTTGGKHATDSLHYKGMAVDFDDFSSPKVDTPGLYAIWKWIYDHFGSKSSELIYAGPGAVSIKNGNPHQYSAATMAAHHNHVHWGMTPQAMAGIGIPQLSVGGNIKYDNTLANLHKGEAVLTAPLTSQLTQGINNMSYGGGEVNITIPGLVVREDADIDMLATAVVNKMATRQRRNGTGRTLKNA